MKDPLGPHFHTNFVWGQRFIGLVLSIFDHKPGSARAIPVDFHYCPIAEKPGKNATEHDQELYRQIQNQTKMSAVGAERIRDLRDKLNQEGHASKELIISVDGGYTNETVLKNLPDGVTLIGRCRKDGKFYQIPDNNGKGPGRKLCYGEALPTPEQIRQSDQYPWQQVEAWAAGGVHTFDVKVLRNIRWRKAGKKNLILLIIRPIAYRLTKNTKLLFKQPAYLIATDPEMDIAQLLQAYLWRRQIEVCFRDQKTLIGCGQAQVRKTVQVEKVPAFVTACYAMMLLAAEKTKEVYQQLPATKCYPHKRRKRITTGDIISSFRTQSWASSMKINFSHFVNKRIKHTNLEKLINPSLASLFYARN